MDKEAFKKIDLANISKPTLVNFSNSTQNVEFLGGSDVDQIFSENGSDILIGNEGADIFVIGENKSGLLISEADVIKDFISGEDKLKLGIVGDNNSTTGNYVELIYQFLIIKVH